MSPAMKGMGGALAAMGLWLAAVPAWATAKLGGKQLVNQSPGFQRLVRRLRQHPGVSAVPAVRKSFARMRASATPSSLPVIITWSIIVL